MQRTPTHEPCSGHSSLTDGQLGPICSVSSLARDGCLGSGFSSRHNMAKQTGCSEISLDSELYIIQQAVTRLDATIRIYIQGQTLLIMPGGRQECEFLASSWLLWRVIMRLWVVTGSPSALKILLKDEQSRLHPHLAVTANCGLFVIAVIAHGWTPEMQTLGGKMLLRLFPEN